MDRALAAKDVMTTLLTKKQVASLTGFSVRTIDRARKDGLPYIKKGRAVRFDAKDVSVWVEKSKVKNQPMITQLPFLEFQVSHYKKRVAEARTIEERIWLRKQLHDLKQRLATFLN